MKNKKRNIFGNPFKGFTSPFKRAKKYGISTTTATKSNTASDFLSSNISLESMFSQYFYSGNSVQKQIEDLSNPVLYEAVMIYITRPIQNYNFKIKLIDENAFLEDEKGLMEFLADEELIKDFFYLIPDLLIYDKAFIHITGTGKPSKITVMPYKYIDLENDCYPYPTKLTVNNTQLDGEYIYDRDTDFFVRDNLSKIFVIGNYSDRLSRYKALCDILEMEKELDKVIKEYLSKGGSMGLIIQLKEQGAVGDTLTEKVKEMSNAITAGLNNNQPIVVGAEDINITQLTKGFLNDIQPLEFKKETRARIANLFGIPSTLSNSDSATLNNQQTSQYAFTTNILIPMANEIGKSLSKRLMPLFNIDSKKYTIAVVESDITLIATKEINDVVLLVNSKLYTINEARKEIGKGPVEGGDNIYLNPKEPIILTDKDVKD